MLARARRRRSAVARIKTSTTLASVQNEYFDSVAVSSSAVWQASDAGNSVIRVDPRNNHVVARVAAG